MESTSEWQKMIFDNIGQRRLHMIERANCILQYKSVLLFRTGSTDTNNEFIKSENNNNNDDI